MVLPKYHIFVCTSCRINGVQKGFCFQKGSVNLVQKFMEEIEARELSADCLVTNTGCFGICDKGPIAVVYPEGVWYGNLDEDAVEEICEKHMEGGTPAEEYRI
ncbi:2Fe-2S ferredoxin [Ruminiclostridium cellobioparum]|uniref:Ferredoxin n=1 Tax=Ruminiclostridium cellobioparum subsp. termitidis CT1112 TaxID=1195236 RepID=S0FIF7_RUMCE|nr:2Fe-2S ferredoxin [Ruminiclostridium cellobioparum]EMS71432.1 Ferredoxin [Ruminiclostridium cellobioparum subsp. termitidis CT1112]